MRTLRTCTFIIDVAQLLLLGLLFPHSTLATIPDEFAHVLEPLPFTPSPFAYPTSLQKPTVPAPFSHYFSLEKAADELVRSLAGPRYLPPSPFVVEKEITQGNRVDVEEDTTSNPAYGYWTKATTPKDQLVEFMEKSFDKFLSGGYGRSLQRPSLPYYLLEEDSLIETAAKEKNVTEEALKEETEMEGSGMDADGLIQHPSPPHRSSIDGISKVMPHIPKVPLDFQASVEKQKTSPANMPNSIASKPEVPEGGFGPLLWSSNIRRHPTAQPPKSAKEFQYGSKPSYQQGFVSSVLDFLGIQAHQRDNQPSELDRAITEWILQHSPTTTTRSQKRAKTDSPYNVVQKFITQSVMPLCNPQPVVVEHFDLKAFMGQWFQVMYSPLMSSTSCSMMNYDLLSQSDAPNAVGSVFQTLEYSSPRLGEYGHVRQALSSGYAMVSRKGQIIYRKSNSPDEFTVHVIHVSGGLNEKGQYEYAILAVNCNYPLYVIARDPLVFKQKHEKKVNYLLQQKGIINDMSRFLNIVTPVDFSYCMLPPTFFGSSNN